jgi:predicted transcriptional regulator
VKTAISIPDEVFEAAERAAKKLGVSRSELYAKAVREFVERYRRDKITEKLDEIGLAVAIEPSQMTTDAIEDIFKFVPKGIPAEWPEGQHQAFKVEIFAEEFCIQCHITAQPVDVLGQVEVRSYLGTQLQHWWDEVKLATTLGMGKILLHTVILFFLLKARMEPLLSLQSMIAVLAKSGTRLSHRAPVKSHDEF